MRLSEKLARLKSRRGLTTDALSLKSGVPKGTINKLLNGETRNPTIGTLKALAGALECPLEWLSGYMAGTENEVYLQDESGQPAYAVIRGTPVEYAQRPDGRLQVRVGGVEGYCQPGAVKTDPTQAVPEQVQYVRTAVNLRTEDGKILDYLTNKGDTVSILGYPA